MLGHRKVTQEISDLIRNKISPISDTITDAECGAVAILIENTINTVPVSSEIIISTLRDPRFKIVATTISQIRSTLGSATASAYFSPEELTLFISSEACPLSLINHEFIHADAFLRHFPLLTDKLKATFPIYLTAESTALYEQSLDKGDERIREYQKLWRKNKTLGNLTPEEKIKLNAYNTASSNCLLPIITDINKPHVFAMMQKAGVKVGSVQTNDLVSMKILEMNRTPTALILTLQHTDPACAMFHLLEETDVESRPTYSGKSSLEKLIERDAYTRQRLSREALETFYPETLVLLEADRKNHPAFNPVQIFVIPGWCEAKRDIILENNGVILNEIKCEESENKENYAVIQIASALLVKDIRDVLGIDRRMVTFKKFIKERYDFFQNDETITIEIKEENKFLVTFPIDKLELVTRVINNWSSVSCDKVSSTNIGFANLQQQWQKINDSNVSSNKNNQNNTSSVMESNNTNTLGM